MRTVYVAACVALLAASCGSNPEVINNDDDDDNVVVGGGGSSAGGRAGEGSIDPIPRAGAGGTTPNGEGGGAGADEGSCGDGALDAGETCDDGNGRPGDGCSGTCRVELGYACPTPGELCEPTAACGDGLLDSNEICDDGNADADDGCSDVCEVEPGYVCRDPGEPCTPSPRAQCGNAGVEFGETCDDGDADDGDGCDSKCQIEPGYNCPEPGTPCIPKPKCGDSVRSPGEQCDDGGEDDGDGCNARCRVEGPYWDCSKAGEPCVSLVECGDGKALGDEECDDGDETAGDGCSATCTVEPGWTCPPGGGSCWIRCGDGEVAGTEQCDDGDNEAGDGCSPICQLELGFKCAGSPSECEETDCGDGTKEGLEQCDDGNELPFDGCSPTCTNEPGCVDANGNRRACQPVCGDGLKFPTEACDDGNTRAGDGCSTVCTVEAGHVCEASAIPDKLGLPTIYRDFSPGAPPAGNTGHPDFQWNTNQTGAPNTPNLWYEVGNGGYKRAAASSPNRINFTGNANWNFDTPEVVGVPDDPMRRGPLTRFVRPALSNGSAAQGGAGLLGKPVFVEACPMSTTGADGTNYLRRNGVYFCANTVQSATSFSQWFTNSAFSTAVPDTLTLIRCPSPVPANHPVCASADADTFLFDSDNMLPDGTECAEGDLRCDGFFPLEGQAGTKYADCGPRVQGQPNSGSPNGRADNHNFHFTSEVRYWFQYDPAASATLTFTGDDDVFVFVNGRLVVDLGGVHGRILGSVTLNANTIDKSGALLSLTNGAIYEIAVFQAERNTCASNYRLQLKNFILGRSTCRPRCGDGVVTPDEQCDKGAQNVPPGGDTYDQCTNRCELGPRCGDGIAQASEGEECDNGLNNDLYMTSEASCASGCVLPPSCGDGNVDVLGGELCDAGTENSDDAYGPEVCTLECQPAPYCGDRSVDVDFGEVCDDGVNNGQPGSCTPDCKGTVELPSCGNGRLDGTEQCDDGSKNGTAGSGCDPRCRLRCGNGFKDPGEECDDGVNDGEYGGCNEDCTPAGYCGDGEKNGPEQCDLGDDNGAEEYGEDACTATCRPGPYCGDGRIQTDFGERCDSTPGCGNNCRPAIPK